MYDVPSDAAAARARCLSDLDTALDKAEVLLQDLLQSLGPRHELIELAHRMEGARIQLLSLRLSRPPRVAIDPDWTKLALWRDGGPSAA